MFERGEPHRIPLLDAEQCRAIAARIFELRPHWTQRLLELPSFTLGAAAYFDLAAGMPRYLVHKQRSNRLLRDHFAEMYGALTRALEQHFGERVTLSRRRALPGFHIYLFDPALAQIEPKIHFDLQDIDLELAAPGRPDGDRCSFTLPIQIPTGGAGLNVWNLSYQEVSHLPHAEALEIAKGREKRFFAYELGELFVHTGDQLHQIADHLGVAEGDARITLQGHGQRTADGWELYW